MSWRSKDENRRSMASFLLSECGSSLVETVVSSAIFVGTLLGVLEMSLACYTYNYVDEAAREGSRYAIVRGSTSCTNTPNLTNCNATTAQIQSYVKGLGYAGIDATNRMTVTVSYFTASSATPTTWSACTSGTCNAPGNLVKVAIAYSFPLSIPFFTVTNLSLHSSSSLVIAQ